ncbi:transglutaminase family protein [Paenibacillus sp. GD4]|jgi:transglutaminase-like putative cysteine protease|uniref:transglutaminase-like domain-containing protein n=1 Tax=Paenibacillus sp. GD4 TaxID=3068890 RepID=UPI00279650CA|nr:transglutaminase family protein [Paenibacillus sp. GD4]MDQ1912741.1 transglutaminase family protein [Paenibacillus sp. GD4]
MKLICESDDVQDYLAETEELDWQHADIKRLLPQLVQDRTDELDIIQSIFEFVRDEVNHSWDIQSRRITRKASEVLQHREGICYAKSNLLAALLRLQGIPAGFCYQKLTIGDTPDTGYCIHALNAVYLASENRWIRLDARGNKEGINSQFSIHAEQLAFPVRTQYNEVDYPTIYSKPNAKTMQALRTNTDCIEMYRYHLPVEL